MSSFLEWLWEKVVLAQETSEWRILLVNFSISSILSFSAIRKQKL